MNSEEIMKIEDRYFTGAYQKFPIAIVRGRGARLWDAEGREYIDCMGGYGVAIVGHCNPRVVDAIRRQAELLIICHGSLYNDARAELLEKLVKIAPRGLGRVYLSNSGAEAIECAIKLARRYTEKPEVLAMTGGFHGKTFGALSTTWNKKYRAPFSPLLPGVKFAPFGRIDKVEDSLSDETAAILVEPIQGESGIHVAPDEYLAQLREICDRRNILLIFDEIQSGFGRTGRWWACQNWDVEPDILCSSKGLGGGLPIGATLAREEIMTSLKPGEHTSTFGGNPLSCTAASAAIDYIIEEDLLMKAKRVGQVFREELEKLKEKYKIVREVRGLGLMLGMELRFEVRNIILDGLKKGVILLYCGRNVLRFLPPLIIDEDQVMTVTNVLDNLLSIEEEVKLKA